MIESFNKRELEEKIDRYVNGQLNEQEIEELWIELIQDEYHLDYLKSVANLKAVVENKREKKRKRKVRKTWTFTAAAVVILLVAVLAVFNNFQNSTFTSPVEPVSSIELDYYRSGDATSVESDDDKKIIRNAIELANTGKFNEAVSLLNNELNDADDPKWIAELSLNIGAIHYNEENFQEAIGYFDKIVNRKESVDKLTLEKAYWYKGNAYFQLDQIQEAKANIQKAYDLNGAYRRVAQSYLNALASTK